MSSVGNTGAGPSPNDDRNCCSRVVDLGYFSVQIRGNNLLFEDNDKTTSIEPEE